MIVSRDLGREGTIGAINTGTVKNLDSVISLFAGRGQTDLADAVKQFTNALISTSELKDETKREIAEQLQFLVGQASAKPEQRSKAIAKTVIAGIRDGIATAASIVVIWDKLEPLLVGAITGSCYHQSSTLLAAGSGSIPTRIPPNIGRTTQPMKNNRTPVAERVPVAN